MSKWLSSGVWQWGSEGMIPNTASNSKNPTVAGRSGYIDIAYEHSTSIKYIHGYNQSTNWLYNGEELISAGCGYSHNYCPSISLMGNGKSIVSWTGARKEATEEYGLGKETEEPGLNAFRLITRPKASSWGNFYVAGENVVYTNNNSTSNTTEETVFSFSADNGAVSKWLKRYGSGYSILGNLSHTGLQIQVCGASHLNYMKALVFNPGILPYSLNRSTTVFEDFLGKITADSLTTFGRTGVVYKNGVEFVFFLGDVLLNNENVMFIERADTLPVPDITELNDAMKTNTFSLNSNSDMYFSVSYGVINSDLADSALIENDIVTFRVELVNAENNQVIGTFDEVIYDLNNLSEYDNIDYKVDCTGIVTGNYFFRLVTSVQGDASLFLSNVQNDNEMLLKKNYETVKFNKELLPKEYALQQNFPNPFNPTTTIRYQIPKDGMVTLKVYDILGAEVATLVNEEKIAGKYEVNFNASNIASGVYIYRLKVNDFVNVKKMVLLK